MYNSHNTYLEVSSSCEHRFDSPHTIVIVMLGGELLRAKTIRCNNLDRERSSVDKSTRIENYLSNHGIVRNHHSHRPKQSLQVVRKFRATYRKKLSRFIFSYQSQI